MTLDRRSERMVSCIDTGVAKVLHYKEDSSCSTARSVPPHRRMDKCLGMGGPQLRSVVVKVLEDSNGGTGEVVFA
jgi:hypothetical protein